MNNDHFFRTSIGPAMPAGPFQPRRVSRPRAEDIARGAGSARVAAATTAWISALALLVVVVAIHGYI